MTGSGLTGLVAVQDAIDYTKYYSTLGRAARPTGQDQARYADFSGRAVKAAQVGRFLVSAWLGEAHAQSCKQSMCKPDHGGVLQSKIGEFLAIMPSQDLRTARQMAAPPSDVESS